MRDGKKILFIDSETFTGEGQRNLGDIVCRLSETGYTAYVLSADESESGLVSKFKGNKKVTADLVPLKGWCRGNEATFEWIPDLLKIRPILRQWIKDYDIDIVYANGFYSGLICSLTVPKKYPIIFHAREYECHDVAMEYIIKRAQGTIFVSNFLQNYWLNRLGEEYADSFTTAFNGFDWAYERSVLEKFSFREGLRMA